MAHPSLFRRLLAMMYDSFLIIALLVIGTVFLMFFTKAQAIPPHNHLYKLYLFILWLSFFVWFWGHGGQTTGMSAWRIRLVTQDERPVNLRQAMIRFLWAIPLLSFFGIGLLWTFVDKEKQTLYDRFTKTKLILLPKPVKA